MLTSFKQRSRLKQSCAKIQLFDQKWDIFLETSFFRKKKNLGNRPTDSRAHSVAHGPKKAGPMHNFVAQKVFFDFGWSHSEKSKFSLFHFFRF